MPNSNNSVLKSIIKVEPEEVQEATYDVPTPKAGKLVFT